MMRKTITKETFRALVGNLIEESPVWGVRRKGEHFTYARLETAEQLYLDLDYVRTLLPPKKLCFPPKEELLKFDVGDDVAVRVTTEVEPGVLIGLHPCALHALNMLDLSMMGDRPDEHWRARRAAIALIGVDCLPDASCFCTSMRTNLPPNDGYDLFLTDIGDNYVVEVGSDRGMELLSKASRVEEAKNGDLAAVLAFRKKKEDSVRLRLATQPENIPLALTARRDSAVWKEQAETCLACGSCNTTCATCFCFDVMDRMNLSLTNGVRERQWDGCLLPDFAKVASGENFRSQGVARYRHRYYRKFDYLPVRYGRSFCCGCGRCTVNCVPDIANPVTVLNKVIGETAG